MPRRLCLLSLLLATPAWAQPTDPAEIVIIGRGRLIASGAMSDFITSNARTAVIVRSPDMALLGPALAARGAYAQHSDEGAYDVTGIEQSVVGDLAHEVGARLHELSTRRATLEEAFLDATGMSEEFIGGVQQRAPMGQGSPGDYGQQGEHR